MPTVCHPRFAGRFHLHLWPCLAAVALTFLSTSLARADFINFDALAQNDALIHLVGQTYSQQGFTLTALQGNAPNSIVDFRFAGTQSDLFPGATALFQHQSNGEILLTRTDGGAFAFRSIELAELPAGDANGNPIDSGPFAVTFYGNTASGGTVSETVTVSGFLTLEASTFTGFDDVVSVYWYQGAGGLSSPTHQFDGIQATAVPEPSSLCLVATAGLMLMGFRAVVCSYRRRSKSSTCTTPVVSHSWPQCLQIQ